MLKFWIKKMFIEIGINSDKSDFIRLFYLDFLCYSPISKVLTILNIKVLRFEIWIGLVL